MSRSLRKSRYMPEHERIEKKIEKSKKNKAGSIKTYYRKLVIVPEWVGEKFEVHNGKKFIDFFITPDMVGHKLGDFAKTRKLGSHGKAGKR